ncbi:MAG: TerB family tellurite resistance protein [Prochloraceae cyanobacterium]
MAENEKIKQLLKILIGAAWIDGTIQPEEREHLNRRAKDNQLDEDPEIKLLLSEIKPVKPAECYQWLEEYLGDSPNQEDYQNLLEAISGLIYSDNLIHAEEAKLLTKLQLLEPTDEPDPSVFDKVLKTIQKLYRQAISQKA